MKILDIEILYSIPQYPHINTLIKKAAHFTGAALLVLGIYLC